MNKEQMQYLALDRIIEEQQVREEFDDESLHGLMISLKEVGQLQPIRVRQVGDKFAIVDGARRFRAARKAGLSTMAAIIETKDLCEGEVLQKQLIANCQRNDLSPLEKAKGIQRLVDATGWNASQAAARLGLSNPSVTRLLSLLSLPAEIQERIAAGDIAASAAYELSRIDDAGQQAELANQVASGQLSRDALVGVRKAAGRKPPESSSSLPSRVTAVLGGNRSVTVSSKTLTLDDFIALLEEVLTKARRGRTQGIEIGTFIRMLKDTAHAA